MASGTELSRPPFAIVAQMAPSEVATEIVACFERIGSRPDALGRGHALAMLSIALPADDPMHRAGAAIAADIDRGVGAGVTGGYHNPRHFLEAMLCALYLSHSTRLPRDRMARVVTAALAHDFHHDGSWSASSPFRIEALSAARADPYWSDAGLDPGSRDRMHTLILATETRTGVPFARACLAFHEGTAAAPAAGDAPEGLELLLARRDLTEEAVLLAEADVLPSIGLTVEYGQIVQDRLAAELRIALGARDKLDFIERVRHDIRFAAFFAPNIEAMRQAFRAKL